MAELALREGRPSHHYTLPIGEVFATKLAELVKNIEGYGVTLNFRDEDYNAETGGFHPVEIRLERHREQWRICYITEFCYVGSGYFAELAKAIDFDIGCDTFQTAFGCFPIRTGHDMYEVWEPNFLSYWEMGVFTIKVTPD
ncbi:DUF2787 family protein [Shewanella sp. A32]|uniref:DUF2787 family protein n=1 Tax=Shewanella sp. A32 TaxID=3031327 RepID=UPI0023B98627|nr:DUF2787 family protein [Shewanella sp. A32]MDF0533064.1 DUF2787 family protein [Shewanella sp. A32]